MTAAIRRLRWLGARAGRAADMGATAASTTLRVIRGDLRIHGRDPLSDAYLVFAVLWMGLAALGYFGSNDAVSWYEHKLPYPYDVADYRTGVGFFFTPPIAFAIYPLTFLPWPAYSAVFVGLSLAALRYLAGRWAMLLVLLPPVFWELEAANVNLLIAAAVVFGLRRPAGWSFVLLTKVTPAVGLTWFVVRREWRPLAIALGCTAGISLVAFVFRPDLWSDWWVAVSSNAGWSGPAYFTIPIPLSVRLVIAVALATFAALGGRHWILALAVTIGLPVLWFNGLSILVAALPLWSESRRSPLPSTLERGRRRPGGPSP